MHTDIQLFTLHLISICFHLNISLLNIDKKESELESMYDKWMYVLKNLSNLMQRPAALQERVFTRLFEQAEISKFDKQELKLYEDSVNAYRDIVNAIRTAEKKKYAEGRTEGRAEGEKKAKERIASNLLALGVPIETIMQASGLSEEEIKNIQ